MITASVAHLIPGMMSLSLVGKSAQMIPKTYRSQQNWLGGNGKKLKKTNTIKSFTEIMIGVPLISATAGMTSGL